uniref:2,3-bisphosphoglycerate-independent phosphoglycerate mutase n=1 Tax=Compsothamnion thuioides TaxID=3097386 RepID=A0A4D6WNV8_9FLOR|nr:Phosphoglycerate mutase [Compsothamnion thuyoides]
MNTKPIILAILDGWGYSEKIKGNAIKLANTPTLDYIWNKYPHTLLSASGQDVGLPYNQMGNSEVGHTTIGAGRSINQDLVRIQKSIDTKKFFHNTTIHEICQTTQNDKSKLHIIGLCSNGGVHSHIEHLKAILKITQHYKQPICLHIITDGRDTKPKAIIPFIKEIYEIIEDYKNINICSISGRYYSMDRDCRWSRTEKTYKMLIEDNICSAVKINTAENCIKLINQYYKEGISDEFIPPTKIYQGKISDNDGLLFFNFRPDRTRQLLHCFAKKNFKGFNTKKINNLKITTFTNYDKSLNINTVFASQHNENFLGQIISQKGLKQLRLAETEKYAHVTYFFNGGIEEPFPGEDRILISSPKVETYDLSPEMSANEITKSAISAVNNNKYKLIIINYANPDMVGHTGSLEATVKAINFIDKCIEELTTTTVLNQGTLIITADHGNAEYMLDNNNKPCKSHSTNLVPLIIVNEEELSKYNLKPYGSLSDIAPTILDILHLKKPTEMKGKSLITQPHIKLIKNFQKINY